MDDDACAVTGEACAFRCSSALSSVALMGVGISLIGPSSSASRALDRDSAGGGICAAGSAGAAEGSGEALNVAST